MNERIFELAQQAEEYATTRHPMSNIALSVNSEKFVKKFAELIVKECAGIDFRHKVGMTTDQEFDTGRAIREHFGVQE